MNDTPQDMLSLKSILRQVVRKAVQEYVETTIDCPPGLVGYLVAECWPSSASVTQAVINEHEARAQQAEEEK